MEQTMTVLGVRGRRARVSILGRLDVRMLVGMALVVLSAGGSLMLWNMGNDSVPVLAAARDLPAGHVLTADDLIAVPVRLPADQLARTLSSADRDQLVGRATVGSVTAGELLSLSRLASRLVLGPDDAAVTIPLRADSVYARLRPGDTVTVLATHDKGKPTSKTTTLLARATVYAVAAGSTSVTTSTARTDDSEAPRRVTNVTLLVTKTDTEALAHAAVNDDLTLALLVGASKGP
jgi:Flp pilus assembly protein CpaB